MEVPGNTPALGVNALLQVHVVSWLDHPEKREPAEPITKPDFYRFEIDSGGGDRGHALSIHQGDEENRLIVFHAVRKTEKPGELVRHRSPKADSGITVDRQQLMPVRRMEQSWVASANGVSVTRFLERTPKV
jgi:hypothetical protein